MEQSARYDSMLLQASSQGPPVSAVVCAAAGTAPFVWRRCDCLAISAPFTNIQTYLLTYLPILAGMPQPLNKAVESTLISDVNFTVGSNAFGALTPLVGSRKGIQTVQKLVSVCQ